MLPLPSPSFPTALTPDNRAHLAERLASGGSFGRALAGRLPPAGESGATVLVCETEPPAGADFRHGLSMRLSDRVFAAWVRARLRDDPDLACVLFAEDLRPPYFDEPALSTLREAGVVRFSGDDVCLRLDGRLPDDLFEEAFLSATPDYGFGALVRDRAPGPGIDWTPADLSALAARAELLFFGVFDGESFAVVTL